MVPVLIDPQDLQNICVATNNVCLPSLSLQKEESTPRDLDFWLEDLYTPGFDSLLKKKEAEHKRRKLCKIASLVILSVCAILIVIIVPLVVLQKQN